MAAYLFFGVCFPEDHEFPWEDEEDEDNGYELWLLKSAGFPLENDPLLEDPTDLQDWWCQSMR